MWGRLSHSWSSDHQQQHKDPTERLKQERMEQLRWFGQSPELNLSETLSGSQVWILMSGWVTGFYVALFTYSTLRIPDVASVDSSFSLNDPVDKITELSKKRPLCPAALLSSDNNESLFIKVNKKASASCLCLSVTSMRSPHFPHHTTDQLDSWLSRTWAEK